MWLEVEEDSVEEFVEAYRARAEVRATDLQGPFLTEEPATRMIRDDGLMEEPVEPGGPTEFWALWALSRLDDGSQALHCSYVKKGLDGSLSWKLMREDDEPSVPCPAWLREAMGVSDNDIDTPHRGEP